MSASTITPYELLGAKPSDNDLQLRTAYRNRILEYKQSRLKDGGKNKISAEKFRLICRANETLSDHDKRKRYDENKEWISDLPLNKYTLQQLAAEPELFPELKIRLQKVTLRRINARDPLTGHTPLYCAARACNIEAVKYLTQQGAEPDLAQRTGSTALHVSAFYGHPEMVRCLLQCGADYRKQNSFNNLAESEALNDDVKHVFAELKKDPFVQAAANQIEWFKENIGKIPQHIDTQYHSQGQTLLHCACKKGYEELTRWLIEKCSANLDIIDINANSALHLAAYGGYQSIVEFLLNRGANTLLINQWGMTAEQEGMAHESTILKLFQAMRAKDMFKMAADGSLWWFKYHFGDNSPNTVNNEGTSLLYVACRCGQTAVARWLLDKGANVDVQLASGSRSTPLHGAAYYGHSSIVELLLQYGADVNIRNQYGETALQNARSDEVKKILAKYRKNLEENKIFAVHLYGDGKKSGNEPLAKIQLPIGATRQQLIQAMPDALRKQYMAFSIARRPLYFENEESTVMSAVCRARYGKTKFVDLPLCITAHESPRYMNSGHVARKEDADYTSREFQGMFMSKCETSTMKIRAQLNTTQTFTFKNLSFVFPINCAEKDLSIEVQYLFSPDVRKFCLPECVCIFQTRFESKKDTLIEMPIASFNNDTSIRLYNWMQSSPYWFGYNTKQTRLLSIGEVHAFIRPANIIPAKFILPPDMFIQALVNKPLVDRDNPVYCKCLQLREHNTKVFPYLAYHGTNINVIPSILMDGLVMPSTVVSNGFRVCPPDGHIPRGESNFGIDDFANAIFVSPSIHYCSDPVYAVTFTDGDRCFIAVLECTVKKDSFQAFPGTVPTYEPHPSDNPNELEWRLTNPAAFEIISVLFIPVIKSRVAAVHLRANKLGVDPNDVA